MRLRISHKLATVILLMAVILMAGYIGAGSYNGYMISTVSDYYIAGYNDGVTAAIQQVLVQSDNCNPVPVFFGNFTRNLIDTSCLQLEESP